ncbi:MAG: nitrilase-related carbon-nitrogen hydrolase [Candidatus Nanoarchaeia archaeon]
MNMKVLTPKFPITPKSEDLQKHQQDFLDLCKTKNADIYIAPEYLFASQQPMTVEKKEELLKPFLEASKGNKLIIPGTIAWTPNNKEWYNTLYALSNGKVIHEYHKETTNEEATLYPSMTYQTPENHSSVFEWNNYKIGTEICRDHGMGRLKKHLQKTTQLPVDLQLVLANNTTFSPSQFAVQDKGLVLLVDGNAQQPSNSLTDSKNTKLYEPYEQTNNYEIYEVNLK